MKAAPAHASVVPAPDRRSFEIVLRVVEPAPLEAWSLLLGEYLHDARSALDALTWELANMAGQTPERPQAVQFPLELRASDFRIAEKTGLATVAEEYRGRLRQLQPFTAPDPANHAFSWLRHLSNHDKHRALVACTVAMAGTGHANLVLDGDEPPGPEFHRVEQVAEHPVTLVDGTVLQRHIFDRPWKPGGGKINTNLRLTPTVTHPEIGTSGLRQVVETISAQVGIALDFVRSGAGPVVAARRDPDYITVKAKPQH
jgi:hypothetical protein